MKGLRDLEQALPFARWAVGRSVRVWVGGLRFGVWFFEIAGFVNPQGFPNS